MGHGKLMEIFFAEMVNSLCGWLKIMTISRLLDKLEHLYILFISRLILPLKMALMENGFMRDSKDLANIVVNGSCGMQWALIMQEVILTMAVIMGAIRRFQEDQATTMETIMEVTKQ